MTRINPIKAQTFIKPPVANGRIMKLPEVVAGSISRVAINPTTERPYATVWNPGMPVNQVVMVYTHSLYKGSNNANPEATIHSQLVQCQNLVFPPRDQPYTDAELVNLMMDAIESGEEMDCQIVSLRGHAAVERFSTDQMLNFKFELNDIEGTGDLARQGAIAYLNDESVQEWLNSTEQLPSNVRSDGTTRNGNKTFSNRVSKQEAANLASADVVVQP